jgi:cobalt/nickel transport system permease protein
VLLLVGLLAALVLAGGVSYYASARPDGLERVAADQGIADRESGHDLADSPVADHQVRGVGGDGLPGRLARVLGVLATLAAAGVLFRVVGGRRRDAAGGEAHPGPNREPAAP